MSLRELHKSMVFNANVQLQLAYKRQKQMSMIRIISFLFLDSLWYFSCTKQALLCQTFLSVLDTLHAGVIDGHNFDQNVFQSVDASIVAYICYNCDLHMVWNLVQELFCEAIMAVNQHGVNRKWKNKSYEQVACITSYNHSADRASLMMMNHWPWVYHIYIMYVGW